MADFEVSTEAIAATRPLLDRTSAAEPILAGEAWSNFVQRLVALNHYEFSARAN
jgi:hypothetical protein